MSSPATITVIGLPEHPFTENWMKNSHLPVMRPTYEDFKVPGTFFAIKDGLWVGMILEYFESSYYKGAYSNPKVRALFWNNCGRKDLTVDIWKLDNFNMDGEYRFLKPEDT